MPEFIRDMRLAVASFDRAHEPEGVSTMEWGTKTAIDTYRKLHNRVPDVVYGLGAVGKEPMVRLLAHRAVDAAEIGVEIGRRMKGEKMCVSGVIYGVRISNGRQKIIAINNIKE